jgi:LemA protein
MGTFAIVVLVEAGLLAVYGTALYNGLSAGRNTIGNALSQISVQLQRRHDLIPNLVETAKAYMAHERQTLEAVVTARDQAQTALSALPTNQSAAIPAIAGAEGALSGALGRMFALAEAFRR